MTKEKEIAIDSLTVKKGDFLINGRPIKNFFSGYSAYNTCLKPLTLTNNADRFATFVKVRGGGINGQLDAVTLGLARALVKIDNEHKTLLRTEDLLTRDARVRERRKVGTGGKARHKKQSPKR